MSKGGTGLEPLKKRIQLSEDWIPDLVLERLEDDRLGHTDIVRKVADLIQTTETPANIAVFGPWGSGKSSFGRLIERELKHRNASSRVIFFDAWKYDEAPLRRHFLSVAAQALTPKSGAADMKSALYTRKKKVEFKFDDQARASFDKAAKGVVALVVGGTIALAAFAAFATGIDSFWVTLGTTVSESIGPLLLSTTALSIVAGALLSSIRRDYEEYEPSSAEQFDDIFSSLVEKAPPALRPIVFFVDELDRASPKSVVTMLETLKTFLGTKNCVFLVAADQIALETAVKREGTVSASQEANPYYSSGSAYLDKIFQYQFNLPAVRTTRLSKFALDLVERRGGLWADLGGSLRYVVSVLIPWHVRSLRRVKVLLNNFALTYRVFEARQEQLGFIDLVEYAPSIAKLVCLRTEFPLFFRALEDQPELANALTAKIVGDQTSLARYSSNLALIEMVDYYAQSGAGVDVVVAPPSIEAEGDSQDQGGARETGDAPALSRANQLHDYLRRTREIAGPAPALIYLDSNATPIGLDSSLAVELEGFAVNGDRERAAALIAGLGENAGVGLRFLASLISDGLGVERPNIARVLLASASRATDEQLASVASELVAALDAFDSSGSPGADDVRTVLRLGALCSWRERLKVEATVLANWSRGGQVVRQILRNSDLLTANGLLDLRRRLSGDLKSGGSVVIAAARRTATGLGEARNWEGEPANLLGLLLPAATDPTLANLASEIAKKDASVGWTIATAAINEVNRGEDSLPKLIVDFVSNLQTNATGESANALLASIPRHMEFRQVLANQVSPESTIEPRIVADAMVANIQQAIASDTEAATSRLVLARLIPLLQRDAHIGELSVPPLVAGLDKPWAVGDEVTRRRVVDLLEQVAMRVPDQAGLWRVPVARVALAAIQSSTLLDAKGREFTLATVRGVSGEPAGELLNPLFDALEPTAATGSLAEADRRYLRMVVATTRRSQDAAELKSDADAAALGRTATDRLTTALFVAAADLALSDATPYLRDALNVVGDTFSGRKLTRYFSQLASAGALETLTFAIENGLPAPVEAIRAMRPQLDERKATKAIVGALRSARTNDDRTRLIRYLVTISPEGANTQRQVEKQLIEVAGLNKGAFETVVSAMPDMFSWSDRAIRELGRISRRHEKVSISRRARELLTSLGARGRE